MADKLTFQDPVDPETMKLFTELDTARYELGDQLLDIEQDRIRILASAHSVDTQKKKLFERVLSERGLDPTAKISIDFKSGAITVHQPPK